MNEQPAQQPPSGQVVAAVHEIAASAIHNYPNSENIWENYPYLCEAAVDQVIHHIENLAEQHEQTATVHQPTLYLLLDVDGVIAPLTPHQTDPHPGFPTTTIPAAYGHIWEIPQPIIDALHRWVANPAVHICWISAWEESVESITSSLGIERLIPWLSIIDPAGSKVPTVLEYKKHLPDGVIMMVVDDELTNNDITTLQEASVQHIINPTRTALTPELLTHIDNIISVATKTPRKD